MARQYAVVLAVAVCSPEYCKKLAMARKRVQTEHVRKLQAEYIHILLSIDPEAIRCPAGSNLAENISPECPVSSMTGAWSPLVRGA